jgi:O-antigen/teichoic acid export membrane protein
MNSVMGLNGTVLAMTRYASDCAWIVAVGATVNVLLNAWLIPIYGSTGAAISTASSMVIWNILLSLQVYRRLGINATIFYFRK